MFTSLLIRTFGKKLSPNIPTEIIEVVNGLITDLHAWETGMWKANPPPRLSHSVVEPYVGKPMEEIIQSWCTLDTYYHAPSYGFPPNHDPQYEKICDVYQFWNYCIVLTEHTQEYGSHPITTTSTYEYRLRRINKKWRVAELAALLEDGRAKFF